MRIGVMLRAYDEYGGIGVYARNLVPELLRIDCKNHYVLWYRNSRHLGQFAHCANVTERWVRGSNNLFWDQVAIPYWCQRDRVDVVLHPKFTAPLLALGKVVMVVHGADWFMEDQQQYYSRADVAYMRLVMPLYLRKCAAVISVSQLTTDNFRLRLGTAAVKIRTVYFGPARHFQRCADPETLRRVQSRYHLPDRYVFHLTKRGGGERKNLGRVFQAYARYHAQAERPYPLVVGGKDGGRFRADYGLPETGYGLDILFPGWIDQADMPAVYSLADVLLYPSNLEAFPIPIVEAMACGTPIITSNVNGLQEIAGDAALQVDPRDAGAIAEALGRVLSDASLRTALAAQGLARSSRFTWDKCARETLAILESVGA
jgi:glycosyltransferase involved in cell wall biosynthesis